MKKMLDFCGSPIWNSNLTWHTEDPFLAPCFELTILVWFPCSLLFIFTPLEVYYIKSSKYSSIPWGLINIIRLVIPTLLICLSIVDISMAASLKIDYDLYAVHIVTPIIKLFTFILATILTYFHKKDGIVSSGPLFFFWFTLWMFAIPQYRTEIIHFQDRESTFGSERLSWNDYQFLSYMLYFPLVTIQLLVYCLADKKPLQSSYNAQKKPNPEIGASFVRKLFFLWFDSFTWMGYRKPLTTDDMWDIRPEDTSRELIPEFDKNWLKSVEKGKRRARNKFKSNKDNANNKETEGSILPAMFKTFGGDFYFAGVLKLAMDLLAFASPQILNLLINFTSDFDAPLWHGILYAVALFLVSVGSSLINGQFLYKSFLVGFRIRSVLISAIYRKALTISNSSKKDTTVGEIVNLMIIDAQRFFEIIQYLHIIWAGPLTVALSVYFLYQILGVAVFSGLVVMLLMFPLNAYIATKLKNYQIIQMKRKDERVKFMNETLSGIKVLKLYAWEPSFQEAIQNVRDEELRIITKTAYMNGVLFAVWTIAPFLVTLASFATFVLIDENNVFDATTAFVALSLFNILRQPLTMFPLLISFIMQAKVSIDRINRFLNSEDLDAHSTTHERDENAVRITDGSFSWDDEVLVLKNINLFVNRGSLVAVVGPVGAGKSSLIASILGETKKISGALNTDGSLAFVSQQAWIQNATLKDNILFGKKFRKDFYEKVVEACALTQDFRMLPGGDQTEIGEKGINLSGGQKQRVALARAAYSQAEIFLFDDPLSAVDSHVGKHIFEKLIGPRGILSGKTRILVTHSITYLPSVDSIYVMNGGEITESGHYDKLIAEKGDFSKFIIEHLQQYDDDDAELADIKEVLSPSAVGSVIFERAISMRRSSSEIRISSRSRGSRQSMSKTPTPDVSITKLIEKEESATGSVGFGVYIRYFKSIGLLFCSIIIIGGVANQAFSVYSNTWLSTWAADSENNIPHLRDTYLSVYGGLGLAQCIGLLASSIAVGIGCVHAAKELHNNLLTRTMRLPMSFFDTTPLGRIMNRFSKDVDVVDNIIPQILRIWFLMIFNAIAIFIVISISTPIFTAVIVPILILYYLIQNFYVRTSRQLKRIESVTRSPIYSHFTETITGQSTIRAYSAQSRFIADSEKHVDYNQKCSYPSIVAIRWLGVRLEIVSGLVIFFSALFAVLGRETINEAIVGLSVSYALQITSVLNYLVRMSADLETNIVANERMEEYSNINTEAEWITKPVDPSWPSRGQVVFENYKVKYRENLDLVLKGCSFEIQGGEKVGIVGRTGAGKSSLTLGLFRIIEAAGGKITIDGLDISDMGLQSLRSRLTIIPQDPVLFSGTLRMNIDPFDVYTDDAIWLALEHAHLKGFVKSLEKGLLFDVTEGGENLSVGQRQLICLARALLRKSKLLILDEATAAVDLETDDLIQKTIRSQFNDCTILTIAHRLNTIMDSDKVLVLDRGEVAEFESPTKLIDDKNSIFYGMAKDAGLVGK